MIFGDRHIGRFIVSLDMFKGAFSRGTVRRILADVIVIRAELSAVAGVIEYTGISPGYFSEVPEGCEAPMYEFIARTDGDIECRKLDG